MILLVNGDIGMLYAARMWHEREGRWQQQRGRQRHVDVN